MRNQLVLCLIILVFSAFSTKAQEARVIFPQTKIAVNQMLQMQIELKNGQMRNVAGIPNIPGFQKGGTSTSSNMSIINGKMSQTFTLTQNYRPTKKGTFKIAPFTLTVNGQPVKSQGATIQVGDAIQQRRQNNPFARDPFFDPFGMFQDQPTEYVEVEADAFFALTPNKRSAYVGEEIHVTLAFYESADNKAVMDFHNLQEQLSAIITKLKPENCWEENFQIMEIKREQIELNGKSYNRYKLYEGSFFPLSAKNVRFPKLELQMVKYKQAKRRSFFQPSMKRDLTTFTSKPFTVKVKELPPHPLKDKVAVGQFEMKEYMKDTMTFTNQGLSYTMEINGKGNISSLPEPILSKQKGLEIYPPSTYTNIERAYGKVYGSRAFEYFLVPHKTGNVDLSKIYQWIYFDTEKEKYDTLVPSKTFVTKLGEKAAGLTAFVEDPFYRKMGNSDNALVAMEKDLSLYKWLFGLFVAIGSGAMVFTYYKRRDNA